jgi:hypothetical protein
MASITSWRRPSLKLGTISIRGLDWPDPASVISVGSFLRVAAPRDPIARCGAGGGCAASARRGAAPKAFDIACERRRSRIEGPSHRGLQAITFLSYGGGPYAHDPPANLGSHDNPAPLDYSADARLPADARWSGWHRGDRQLWISPADFSERAIDAHLHRATRPRRTLAVLRVRARLAVTRLRGITVI